MKRRTAAFFLVICILLSAFATTLAAGFDEEIPQSINPKRYSCVTAISASLSIDSTGNATCGGSITMYNNCEGDATLSLQKNVNNQWITVKSWGKHDGPQVILSKTFSVTHGYDYRTEYSVEVYKNGVYIETATVTSPTSHY